MRLTGKLWLGGAGRTLPCNAAWAQLQDYTTAYFAPALLTNLQAALRLAAPGDVQTKVQFALDQIAGGAVDAQNYMVMAAIARQVASHGQPFAPPCVLLSGGETTVTVRGSGRGGRNVEFLLSLGIALDGYPGIHALAADTDGVDGLEEIAGAYLAPDSLARARALGIRPAERLADNDAHGFFEALGDTVVTGPTLTNVNDFRAILIEAPREPAAG